MSFIRAGNRSRIVSRKKARPAKKPGWDSTIHDLSVYKPTKEEMLERRIRHQSKNHMSVKLENMRKDQSKKDKTMLPADMRKMAIIKEILYDQNQLQETLAKSDKMMAVVKDLFGDEPKRYTGFPNVTSASTNYEDHKSFVAPVPEIYTRMDALSDSVTNPTPLNEYHGSESDEDTSAVDPIIFEPKMNLQRFQQFIESEEEKNQTLSSISGPNQVSRCDIGPAQSTRIQDSRSIQNSQDGSGFVTPRKEHNESIEMLRTPQSAINDTKRVKKTKKRTSPQKNPSRGTNSMQFTDFRKVLLNLQDEIAEFEKQSGRCPPAEQQRSDTLSGYTVALVDAVTKLARYLRQTDLQQQGEMAVREVLIQDMNQFRHIVDSLTADLISTQEQHAKLDNEFHRYRLSTTNEINILRKELQELKMAGKQIVPGRQQTSTDEQNTQQSHCGSGDWVNLDTSIPGDSLKTSQNSAVMLSPVVRKTRIPEAVESAGQTRQVSLVDLPSLAESNPHSSVPKSLQSQALPPAAVVTVPRPKPLVQRNVCEAWPETKQERGLARNESMHSSVSSTYQSLPGAVTHRNIESQIADLNRQHEEAQKRTRQLLQQQKTRHLHIQQHLQQEQTPEDQQQAQSVQQQQQQQQQQIESDQQQFQQKAPSGFQHHQQQQQQMESGSKNHLQLQQAGFQQLQQQQQQQQHMHKQIQHQHQLHTQEQRTASAYLHHQQQQPIIERHTVEQQQQQQQQQRTQQHRYYIEQNNHTNQTEISTELSSDQRQAGYYNKNLTGAQNVSPPISPISQRSEGIFQIHKETSRGITVSIPTAELDMSGSPSPRTVPS